MSREHFSQLGQYTISELRLLVACYTTYMGQTLHMLHSFGFAADGGCSRPLVCVGLRNSAVIKTSPGRQEDGGVTAGIYNDILYVCYDEQCFF